MTLPVPIVPNAAALRVLYVEDNRINAILFEEAMRARGDIDLHVAEDGQEAVACIGEDGWLPQLLVLDAHLPDTNGHALLALLRQQPALLGVPAWMCSADAADQEMARALACGFQGYWAKPLDWPAVHRDINALQARLGVMGAEAG